MIGWIRHLFNRYEFWLYKDFVTIVSVTVSLIFLCVLWFLTKKFSKRGWRVWLPVFICLPIFIINFVMMLLPNGTGGVTVHFYLGVCIYAFDIMLYTCVGEGVIIFIKYIIKMMRSNTKM